MNDRYLFSVSVCDTIPGRHLGKIEYDEYGYCWHPVAVLNHHTENRTFYEPEVYINQLTGSDTIFRKNLERGNLFGECEHPDVEGTVKDLPRLLRVATDRISHHIKAIKTVPLKEVAGAYLILALLKPHGVFGPQLKESLDSPFVNTTFSLRTVVKERYDPKRDLRIRSVISAISFDWVSVPGSPEASKRYCTNAGTEAFSAELTSDVLKSAAFDYGLVSGFESSSESSIQKLINDLTIKVSTTDYDITGLKSPGESNLIDLTTGDKRSLVHAGLRMKGGII